METRTMRTLNRLRVAATLWLLALGAAGAQTVSQGPPSNCITVLQAFPNQPLTGTLTETNLAAVKIPANSLGPNGALRISAMFNITNNANAKIIVLRYNTTAGNTTTNVVSSVSQTTVGAESMQWIIRNSGATGAQTTSGSPLFPYGTNGPAFATIAVDTAQDTYINFNGTLANVGDTITLLGWTVEILKP
jgi:hypothetical protein